MAKQEKANNTRTSLESVNDSLSSLEQKVENNKKIIYWVIGAILAILAVAAIWYVVRQNGAKEATEQIGKADIAYFMEGKADSAATMYKKIFDNNSYKPANRGAEMYAVNLFSAKKYAEVITYLEKADANGKLIGPAHKSLLADAYINIDRKGNKNAKADDYSKALNLYDEAIKMAGDNQMYTPIFMLKKATVLHATSKYEEELKIYEDMKENFPQYAYQVVNIDKYVERAKALLGK